MKLKNKDLKEIAKALNEVAELGVDPETGVDDSFDPEMDPKELREELEAAVAGKGTDDGEPEIEIVEDDKFTDHQWNILAELGNPTALGQTEEGDESTGEAEDEEPETEEEGDEEDETEELTYDDLQQMTKKKELKEVIEDNDLDIDASKYKKVDDLREAIAEALGFTEDEEEEAEEDEEEEAEEGDEEQEEEAEEGITLEDLEKMTKKKDLKTVAEEYELEVDTSQKVADLRQEIAEKLELVEPEEEEGDEEEEEVPEPPSYDELQEMKKKDLKQVVEDHELDVDTSQKADTLRESIADALGVKPKKGKGKKSESSKKESGKKSEGKKKEKGESRIKGIVNLILEESRTPGELVKAAEEKGLSPSSMRSAISHCKKEDQLARYGMPEVIDKDDDGIIKLAKNCKKNKKSSGKSSGKGKSQSSSSKKKK